MQYQYKIVSSDPKLVFLQLLETKGLKATKQRQLVLDYLLNSKKHASPEDIYRDLCKKDRSIGRATVFRTLHLLEESGFAEKISFGDGRHGYEFKFGRPHHDHMICVECNTVIEFINDTIERIQHKLAQTHKFSPLWHRHEIFGRCHECSLKKDLGTKS